ncbi:MAG: amidohydrolase family protein [Bacilli bacterium]
MYILKNCNIVDVINGEIIKNKIILIDGENIVDIKDNYNGSGKIIDLKNKYVCPGLINLHVHLFGSGKPTKTVAQSGGKSQKRMLNFVKTKLGFKVLVSIVKNSLKGELYGGCTTVRSVGDLAFSDIYVRKQIENKKFCGPRLVSSGPGITVENGHGAGTIAIVSKTDDDFKRLVENNINHHVDLIKLMITGGVMDAKKRGDPGELKMSLEQVRLCCNLAHKNGLLVAAHIESSEGVLVGLKGGVDTIEHGAILDDEMIHLFKENNKVLITTLSPAIPISKLDTKYTNLNEKDKYNGDIVSNGIIEASKAALKNDIKVGLGTDAGCPYAMQSDMWRELCYFKKYVGVSNEFALKTATITNASIIGLDDITGSITKGKKADLIVLNGNPFDDLRNLSRCEKIFVNGKYLKYIHCKKNKDIEKHLDTLI